MYSQTHNQKYRTLLIDFIIKNNICFSLVGKLETKALFEFLSLNTKQIARRTLMRNLKEKYERREATQKIKLRSTLNQESELLLQQIGGPELIAMEEEFIRYPNNELISEYCTKGLAQPDKVDSQIKPIYKLALAIPSALPIRIIGGRHTKDRGCRRGTKDEPNKDSQVLKKLCDHGSASVFIYDGDHEVPGLGAKEAVIETVKVMRREISKALYVQ
ncbi:hypothetical protein G7Y89_g13912 [Cudoniella acicularis]|uniref:Uncharacterized protein n=1 Tax=Cudoniella acicularis TaxID=354080 RepID=A0A8H4R7C1_9HELO|nr:hypothetical protein G7Y89_g13912 [Cudoniella acicularis]